MHVHFPGDGLRSTGRPQHRILVARQQPPSGQARRSLAVMPRFQHAIAISAPPERVWEILVDVERWPGRIPTVDRIERLDDGPLAVGARTRLAQPKLPEAIWTVTELTAGTAFTWTSASTGVRITASHRVEPTPEGSRLTLAIDLAGWLAPVGWLMTRSLTQQYVTTEAASIKAAAEAG
jgi:carbon monoxide dehydrogenase subunit G